MEFLTEKIDATNFMAYIEIPKREGIKVMSIKLSVLLLVVTICSISYSRITSIIIKVAIVAAPENLKNT